MKARRLGLVFCPTTRRRGEQGGALLSITMKRKPAKAPLRQSETGATSGRQAGGLGVHPQGRSTMASLVRLMAKTTAAEDAALGGPRKSHQ